jgi:hypothetical protein
MPKHESRISGNHIISRRTLLDVTKEPCLDVMYVMPERPKYRSDGVLDCKLRVGREGNILRCCLWACETTSRGNTSSQLAIDCSRRLDIKPETCSFTPLQRTRTPSRAHKNKQPLAPHHVDHSLRGVCCALPAGPCQWCTSWISVSASSTNNNRHCNNNRDSIDVRDSIDIAGGCSVKLEFRATPDYPDHGHKRRDGNLDHSDNINNLGCLLSDSIHYDLAPRVHVRYR